MWKRNHFTPGSHLRPVSPEEVPLSAPGRPRKEQGSPPPSRVAPSPSQSRPPTPEALSLPGGQRQARHYPRIPGARLPARLPSQRRRPGSAKMADGDGPGVAAAAAASPQASAPGPSPPPGWRERLRAGLVGTWASLWFVVGLGLLYALRVPLRLCENVAAGERPRLPRGWVRGGGRALGRCGGGRAKAKGQRFRGPWRASGKEAAAGARRPRGFLFSGAAAPPPPPVTAELWPPAPRCPRSPGEEPPPDGTDRGPCRRGGRM